MGTLKQIEDALGFEPMKPSAVRVTTRKRNDIPNITPPDQPYKVEIPSIANIEATEAAMFDDETKPYISQHEGHE